jgi:preprotein translocase subunit SecD
MGVVEPGIFKKGDREIIIELPGYTNEQEARELLSITARLEFRYLKDVRSEKNPNARYEIVLEKDERGEEVVRFRDLGDPKGAGQTHQRGHSRISADYSKLAPDYFRRRPARRRGG